jgi:hypothetical protein
MTGNDDERERGRALMEQAATAIIDGVERLGAQWVVRTVLEVAGPAGADLADDARRAGDAATARVVGQLRALFGAPPEQQRSTPLEIVRTLRHEATAVLAGGGVPAVERDPFEVRSFPDDVYGIVPRSLVDLGDEELGPLLLAWGMGKALAIRGSDGRPGSEP